MKDPWIRSHTAMSLIGAITLLGAVGLWFWLANDDGRVILLAIATLMVTASLGIVWLIRARTARRSHAAWDAYADQEIDRQRRTDRPQLRNASTGWVHRPTDSERRRQLARQGR
jgi:hypothetical protein